MLLSFYHLRLELSSFWNLNAQPNVWTMQFLFYFLLFSYLFLIIRLDQKENLMCSWTYTTVHRNEVKLDPFH